MPETITAKLPICTCPDLIQVKRRTLPGFVPHEEGCPLRAVSAFFDGQDHLVRSTGTTSGLPHLDVPAVLTEERDAARVAIDTAHVELDIAGVPRLVDDREATLTERVELLRRWYVATDGRLKRVNEDRAAEIAAAKAQADDLVEERHQTIVLHGDLADAEWEIEVLTAKSHALGAMVETYQTIVRALRANPRNLVDGAQVVLRELEAVAQGQHDCPSCAATKAKGPRRQPINPGRSLIHGKPIRVWAEPFGPAEVADINADLPVLQRYDDPNAPPWVACLEVDNGGEMPVVMRYGPFPDMGAAVHEVRRWRFVP